MDEDAESLDEVVVVAYGTATKKDLTGAVSVIGGEELNTFPATTVDQALQGKTAGVQITSNTGAPGSPVTVNIRGTGSFGSTTPLYVVDGFPTQDISFVNPTTIQSISILKDASATALYGVRASNGVVIIQTKQGQSGKIQVELNTFVGVRTAPEQVDVLNVNDFSSFALELANTGDSEIAGNAVPYSGWSDPNSLRNINWQDEIFNAAFSQSVNLSVRGGGEKARGAFSLGLYDEEGTLLGSDFVRYDVGFNGSYDVTDKLRVKANIKYVTSQQFQTLNSGRNSLLNLYATIPHLAPIGEANLRGGTNPTNLPVDANGNFGAFPDVGNEAFRDGRNWVAIALENDQDNIRNTILGNADIEWDIYGGLSTQAKIGARVFNQANSFFAPQYYRSNGNIDVRDNAQFSTNQTTLNEWIFEYLLKFDKTFADKHTVNLLGGASAQREFIRISGVQGVGFLNNNIRSIAAANEIQDAFGGATRRTLASIFGRANYNYDRKYYATATLRRDGVGNVFAPGNTFGVFPSFAVGWNIDEESFMDDSVFNILKFRGSWGETGSFAGIAPFGFNAFFDSGSPRNDANFSFDGTTNSVLGLAPTSLPNPELIWEAQVQTNIGLEGELLNNRLYFTVDYYNRESSDFLFQTNVPPQTGFVIQPRNGGLSLIHI